MVCTLRKIQRNANFLTIARNTQLQHYARGTKETNREELRHTMKTTRYSLSMLLAISMFCCLSAAQQGATTSSSLTVPRLVNFTGKAADAQGKAIFGIAGVTFAIYKDQYEGAPLWLETQNAQADSKGNYTVQLGATKPDGLPLDLFSSGDARWLGVTVNGGQEQPRVLLLSVPYALKAADAETIGGLPPSAFVLANKTQGTKTSTKSVPATLSAKNTAPPAANPAVTGKGVVNYIPMWDTTSDIVDSILFQKSSQIGINTTSPAATLDVNGKSDVRDTLTLFPKGTDSTLAVNGTAFKVDQTGKVTFISSQTFPGAGTVTSVGLSAPSSDFTVSGSPITKSGTLNLNWNVAPTSTNTVNAIVKRDAAGNFSAGNMSTVTLTASNPAGLAIVGTTGAPSGAIEGVNTGTSAGSDGVDGITSSAFAAGVAGINNGGGYGVYGTGFTGVYGVTGFATNNRAGIFGQFGTESGVGRSQSNTVAGVWGDGGTTSGGAGVVGTADSGTAGVFTSGGSGNYTLFIEATDASGSPFFAGNQANGAFCYMDNSGNLNCTGAKHAVVPIDGGKRIVAMSAIESPENWFEDAGSAQLIGGVAVVQLDPDFIQTVNTEKEYRVFPVPNGDCRGLYVTNKSANSFEVRELGGGTSNVRFDYRIMAIRRKYETVRFEDHTNDPDPHKMMEQMHKAKPSSSSDPAPVKPASPS
jgi:hypothetical protein